MPSASTPPRGASRGASLRVLLLAAVATTATAPLDGAERLRVSDNRRFLVHEDGRPFFWLGDTAWELFHRLDREKADLYLRTRAAERFTIIQAVLLAELDGLNTPNAYNDPARPKIPLQSDAPATLET